MHELLIDAVTLKLLVGTGQCVVFDVRHDLTDHSAGRRQYEQGHIPGAVFLDHEQDLAAPKTGTNGRHPLPSLQTFLALIQKHGVRPGVQVVVYDASTSAFAAHLWWMLRWAGHRPVAILDGGLAAWTAAGFALKTTQASGAVSASSQAQSQDAGIALGASGDTDAAAPVSAACVPAMPVFSAKDVLANIGRGPHVVLDARAENRFRGEVEPMDPVAGHIPGALNRPNSLNCQPDGRFRPADELRAEFEQLLGNTPADHVIHQCGSGITACHNLFAMELAGLGGSGLYPGSWSEWCSDASRPVAIGAGT